LADDVPKAPSALDGWRGALRALKLRDDDGTGIVALLVQQIFPRLAAFLVEVRADQRDIKGGIADLHGAVGHDDRDAGLPRFGQDAFPARLDDRGERDHVDLAFDEAANRFDLFRLRLLRVLEQQLDARFLRGLPD